MIDVEGTSPTIRCILFPICSEVLTIVMARHVCTMKVFVNANHMHEYNLNPIALKTLFRTFDKDTKALVPTNSHAALTSM